MWNIADAKKNVEDHEYIGKILFENPSMSPHQASVLLQRHKEEKMDSILASAKKSMQAKR